MAKQTVLLVDADTKSARVLEVSLRKAGYSVTLVKSAVEAVEAIEIAQPDLIISDTRLAESSQGASMVDGYQLCRRLRDDPTWYGIPFIFLTSSSSIEDKVRGLQLGVEDYLTKPIYIKELLTRIDLVLARKRREGMEQGRTSRASFSGLLSEMGLVDLLSTIDLGRKSGVAEFQGSSGQGTLMFRDGSVVDARAGRYTGGAAVYRMLHWTDGDFEIRFGPCSVEDVIGIPTQGLLMEGMRRLDEWQRLTEQLPPLHDVYEVDTRELASRLGEIPDEVNQILRAFDGKRSLLQVVDESGFDDLSALATLSKLFFEGLIVPRPKDAEGAEGVPDAGELDGGDLQDLVVPAAEVAPPSEATAPVASADTASSQSDPSSVTAGDGARSALPTARDVVPDHEEKTSTRGDERASETSSRPAVIPEPSAATESVEAKPAEPPAPPPPVVVAQSSAATNGGIASASASGPPATATRREEREERDVSKHRGKRNRSKRELEAESKQSSAGSAAASAAADSSGAHPPAVTAAASAAAIVEPRSGGTVIQFPKNPSTSANPAIEPAEAKPEAKSESTPPASNAPGNPSGRTLMGDAFGNEKTREMVAEAQRLASLEPKAPEEKPSEKAAEAQFEAKAEPKTDDKPADKAPEAKPAMRMSLPPAKNEAKSEAKAEPKLSERTTEPPPPPANKKKDDKSSKGGAKDSSPGKRERTGSLSGELSEDSSSKAFFSDVSYQNAYKTAHDTFDDLKPEDSHESHKNRRLMVVTGGLIALLVAVVGGIALHQRFYGVDERALPTAMTSSSEASTAPTASAEPTPSAEPSASAAPTAEASASAAPTAESSAVASAEPTATAAPSASAEPTPSVAPTASAAPTVAAATAAPTAAAPTAAAATAAPSAAAGPAELLVAAQRARSRGAVPAAAALQAWIDAGGNDATQVAQFAYWLANRGDMVRALEWGQRATTMDPNNQLGWYMVGASQLEGPRANRAAAREALRRCAQLPGRYASECRSL